MQLGQPLAPSAPQLRGLSRALARTCKPANHQQLPVEAQRTTSYVTSQTLARTRTHASLSPITALVAKRLLHKTVRGCYQLLPPRRRPARRLPSNRLKPRRVVYRIHRPRHSTTSCGRHQHHVGITMAGDLKHATLLRRSKPLHPHAASAASSFGMRPNVAVSASKTNWLTYFVSRSASFSSVPIFRKRTRSACAHS